MHAMCFNKSFRYISTGNRISGIVFPNGDTEEVQCLKIRCCTLHWEIHFKISGGPYSTMFYEGCNSLKQKSRKSAELNRKEINAIFTLNPIYIDSRIDYTLIQYFDSEHYRTYTIRRTENLACRTMILSIIKILSARSEWSKYMHMTRISLIFVPSL